MLSPYGLGGGVPDANVSDEGVVPGGIGIGEGETDGSVSSSAAGGADATTLVPRLRACIDVLFYFEKLVDPDHERQRALWRLRARERRDQRETAAKEAVAYTSMIDSQPLQPRSPEPPRAPLSPLAAEMEDEEDLESRGASSSLSLSESPAAESEQNKFRSAVRRWLKLLVDALYTVGGYSDHLYVLSQVLRCRGITRWASFVHASRANARERHAAHLERELRLMVPITPGNAESGVDDDWEWTDDFIRHMMSAVTLVLTPIEGKQLRFSSAEHASAGSHAGHATGMGEWARELAAEEGEMVRVAAAAAASHEDDSKSVSAPASDSAEWMVLDEAKLKNAGNTDVSYRVSLNEGDYCDILANLPLLPFVRSRFYPLFLALARRHVASHSSPAPSTTAADSWSPLAYDNAYESFDRHTLSQSFAEVKTLLHLLADAMTKFPEYPQLAKYIAKQMCLIVGFVGEAWSRAWKVARRGHEGDGPSAEAEAGAEAQRARSGLTPYPCCHACHGFYALLQKELDFCLLRLMCSLHQSGSGVRFFLGDLPFHLLSTEAAGQALLILMNQSRAAEYADSSLSFTPLLLSTWLQYIATPTGVATRNNFATMLGQTDSGYIHVLMALTKLCTKQDYEISPFVLAPIDVEPAAAARPRAQSHSQHPRSDSPAAADDDPIGAHVSVSFTGYQFRSSATDLPLIYLQELFEISYLNMSTRDELFRPCQPFITALCATHPLAISFLLVLCHTHFRYIGAGAVALFRQMDLRAWRPTASDMYILQALLMTPANSDSCELARHILTNLNYDFVITADDDASGGRAGVRDADPANMFFPPRSRTPVLGWRFHRSLLLLLADVRLGSLRSGVLSSSTATASSAPPPPVPFTSFVHFPTCAFQHMLVTAAAAVSRSRRNSLVAQLADAASSGLPQPPSAEHHLQQQFEARLRPGSNSEMTAPAFSSAAPPMPPPAASAASGFAFSAASMSAFLAPASAAIADVFNSRRTIDAAWWLQMLALVATRDTDGTRAITATNSWLSQRYAVHGVDLDDYTAIVRRDPVLTYIQLQVSGLGSDVRQFARDGVGMLRMILADGPYQRLGYRALHDILPGLLRGSVVPSQAATPATSPAWAALAPGAQPPPMYLPPPGGAPSSRRASAADVSPPGGAVSSSAIPARRHSLADVLGQLSSTGLLKGLLEQARPKSVFSFIQGKHVTFEGMQTLAHVITAHLIGCMRSVQAAPSIVDDVTRADTALGAVFAFWSRELQSAPQKSADAWQRDHNLRFLFDTLCRTTLMWNDWTSGDATNAVQAPGMAIMLQFIGAQAMAVAHAHAHADHHPGVERRQDAYLPPMSVPGVASSDVELHFDFAPDVKPAPHILPALLPSESLLTSFSLTPKEALQRHPYATFACLLEETLSSRSAWLKLGHLISRWEPTVVLKTGLKRLAVTDDRIRRQCSVRRWFVHALACPVDSPLLPLLWQQAFRLMFSRLHLTHPPPSNMGGYFGYRLLSGTSGRQLMQQCREHLATLAETFARRRILAIESNRAGGVLHPSIYQLPALFAGMACWLTAEGGVNADLGAHLNSLRERLLGFGVTLQEKYLPERLATILLPTAEKNVPLWADLVDVAASRWEQISDIVANARTRDLLPTPITHEIVSRTSPEAQAHAFFHRYYQVQNYSLRRYAPTPAQLNAIIKRKQLDTASFASTTAANPFAHSLSVTNAASMMTAAEFAVAAAANMVDPAAIARAAAPVGAASRRASQSAPSKESAGYWSATVSPAPPPPVLGTPLGHVDPHSSSLHIPSILLASVWDLLAQETSALQLVRSSIAKFNDRFSHVVALDRQFVDFYPLLFRNEQVTLQHSQACKLHSGCRQPALFHFTFTRAIKVRQIEENIGLNRAQVIACADARRTPSILEEIGLAFCAALIAMQRLFRQVLEVAARPVDPSMVAQVAPRRDEQEEYEGFLPPDETSVAAPIVPGSAAWQRHVVEQGLKWLFGLAELESPLAHLFTPAHFFLRASIASLTPLATHPLVHGVHLQERLVDVMRLHTGLIPTLAAALRPEVATDPHAFLHLLRLAISVRNEHGVTSVTVMERFDLVQWLATQPPLAVRMQLFTLCSQQVRQEEVHPRRRAIGTPAATAAEALCNWYATAMVELTRRDLPNLFPTLLRTALEDTKTFAVACSPVMPAPGATQPRAPSWLHALWQAAADLPLHLITWEQTTQACALVEGAMWEVRRAHHQQVQQQSAQRASQSPPLIVQSNLRAHALLGDLLPRLLAFFVALFVGTHPSRYPAGRLDSLTSAVVCSASTRDKQSQAWQAVWHCFSAFMTPDPQQMPNATPSSAAAPHTDLDAQQQSTLDAFVYVMSILKSGGRPEEGWVLQRFWHCYTEQITVAAEAHFLRLLHQTVIRATKLHDATAEAVAHPSQAPAPFAPIPTRAVLDFRSSWVLTLAHLASFQHTLQQVIDLHELEVKSLLAAERGRRESERASQVALAKGTKREHKIAPIVECRRADVRTMSQVAVKVELVATFLSHIIAACDWSYGLQQRPRVLVPAAQNEDGHLSVAPPSMPLTSIAPSGLYEPATSNTPYELYQPSSATDYATTLLVTVIQVLSELPCGPITTSSSSSASSSSSSSSSTPAVPSPLLPHFQLMLSTLLHIDWISVYLIRLPRESFDLRGSVDEESLPQAELDAMGALAIEREVGSAQSLLEQVSAILYSERSVARVVDEITQMTSAASSAVTSPAPVRQSTLAGLLSNPLAAMVTTPRSSSVSRVVSPLERKIDLLSPGSPLPAEAHDDVITSDVDVYGLIRPYYQITSGELLPRRVSDFRVDEGNALTPITRTAYSFHLMYRLCAPMPPVPYLQQPQSASRRHMFVPLVILLRKSRLFAEWLLSVFHGDDAPRPLMLESAYLELGGALLAHLNEYHDLLQSLIGDEEFIPVLQEFLFVANLEARGVGVSRDVRALTESIFSPQHEKLTLLAVTASCRSIIQLEKLAQFLEQVLQVWKDNHADVPTAAWREATPTAPNHWQRVSATLQVPEISFDEFIFSCLNNGSILTLHVVSVQQLMMSAKMISDPHAGMTIVSDAMQKRTMAQPRASHTHAAGDVASLVSPPLDPKPIQQRIDQLFQWLSKTQVKLPEGKKSKKSHAAASSSSSPASASHSHLHSPPHSPSTVSALDEEDVEPVKLLVIMRTLLEWQGAIAKAYLESHQAPLAICAHMRWSNPLLAHLRLYPDPFPLVAHADKLATQLQQLLLRWIGELKNAGSVLSVLGLSNTARFSTKFRLLLRALHTYLMLHAQATSAASAIGLASGQLKAHKAQNLHFNWDATPANIASPATRAQIMQHFAQHTSGKAFQAIAAKVHMVTSILTQATDPDRHMPLTPASSTFVPLIYAPAVIDQLVACVYPELGM